MNNRSSWLHFLHAAALCFFCLGALVSQYAVAAASSAKEKLVLVAADSIPTAYSVDGRLTGILVDVIYEAFSRTSYTVTIELKPWSRCIEEARIGQVDGIFSIFKTPERQTFLTYTSSPIITQVISFFVLKNSLIAFDGNFESLAKHSIGIISRTSYGSRLDESLKQGVWGLPDVTFSAESNVKKLLAGRVELIPSYRDVVWFTAKSLGASDKIRELSPEIESTPSYLAFSSARDYSKVIAEYEKALLSMKKDGSYNRIFNKYLH